MWATSESEFYSAGSPATAKRYRYMLGTTAYDALNRVKSADFSCWSGSAWTTTLAHDLATIGYDKSGNLPTFQRYRETGTLIDHLSYTYTGGTNRLASLTEAAGASAETWDAEAGSFTYDANGNVKTSPAPYSVTATTYDHRNLATGVTRAGVTTSYRYNEGGWRIAKQVGTGNQELYIQDGPLTLAVFTLNASGTLVSWYGNVLAGAKVVGRQPSVGNRSYYHTDLLGTTRAVVQGAVVVESLNERTLLPGMAEDLGTPAANWARNSGLLRREMRSGQPIRDAHVDPRTGALLDDRRSNGSGSFLSMERDLLRQRGWEYDQAAQVWRAPRGR